MRSCLTEAFSDITRSLLISGLAVLMATPVSLAIASYIALTSAKTLERVFNALVGIPTVLVGLVLYSLLCGTCPLGWTGLLYTPLAVSIGEAILVTPVYVALLSRGFESRFKPLYELALGLGASRTKALLFALRESTTSVLSGAISAYSRAVGELGVALLVGGGITSYTRTASVAIALEVSRGEFECAILIGSLLALAVTVLGVASAALEKL